MKGERKEGVLQDSPGTGDGLRDEMETIFTFFSFLIIAATGLGSN